MVVSVEYVNKILRVKENLSPLNSMTKASYFDNFLDILHHF